MNYISECSLIRKTGISPGNYKFWNSKGECDSWFKSKSYKTFSDYSVIRVDSVSMNGYNVSRVHLDINYNETTECDYISIKRDGDNRIYHCLVTDREYVNENSTRLYFTIDYVASFWDTIELGECLVQRTHVTDDWETGYTASKYLLGEPFGVNIFNRIDLLATDAMQEVNEHFNKEKSAYVVSSAVDVNGDVNNPKMRFISGCPINGYYYVKASENSVEDLTKKYVTFMSKAINKSDSLLDSIISIYYAPVKACGVDNREPAKLELEKLIVGDFITSETVAKIKHAKVLDYFIFRIIGNNGSINLTFAEYGNKLSIDALFTGSSDGRCTLYTKLNGYYTYNTASTNSWPLVSVSGSVNRNEYNYNPTVVNYIDKVNNPVDKPYMGPSGIRPNATF